jgi:hypothetical protein
MLIFINGFDVGFVCDAYLTSFLHFNAFRNISLSLDGFVNICQKINSSVVVSVDEARR